MAKRIVKTSIDWAALEKRVAPEQLQNFFAFKRKAEGYTRRMMMNPPEPPKIDWEAYKKIVPVPGLVDKYQSAYTALKVPYPVDNLSASVDKQWTDVQKEIEAYRQSNKKLIEMCQQEIAKIDALPKYEDMTMEMVFDMFPESKVDFVNKPSFWPHTDDEQLGYVDPTARAHH